MKYLIALLICTSAFAQVAYFPVGKSGANTNYAQQGKCQEIEGQECYNVAICPLAYCDVQTVFEVDPETQINIEKKALVEDPIKKAAHEAAEAAKEAAKLAKEQAKVDAKARLKALKGKKPKFDDVFDDLAEVCGE